MEGDSNIGLLPRLKVKELSDEQWITVDCVLREKFRDFHAIMATSPNGFAAIGDDIASMVYTEVAKHCGTLDGGNGKTWHGHVEHSDLLSKAKSAVREARKNIKNSGLDKKEAFRALNLALRTYSELSRKSNHVYKAKEQFRHEKSFRADFYKYVQRELGDSSSKQQPGPSTKDTVTQSLREIYDSNSAQEYDFA